MKIEIENKKREMLEFKTTDILNIKHLRNSYFYEIQISQDLYIERIIKDSFCYKIFDDSHEVGYFIIDQESTLLEFYLITEALNKKEEIFNQIIQQKSVNKIYCKSFDHVLLTCGHTFARSSRITRTIFRDYINGINIDYDHQVKVHIASKSDIPTLLNYNDGLYSNPDELKYLISNNILYMFIHNNSLLGCGYLTKVLSDKNYYDINVWTNPEFRKQGYGAMIISYMKRYCFSHGYIPVCGCDVTNIAARKTLQKNNFISKHCIIEFILQKPIT